MDHYPTARSIAPWEANPYGLLSWWDMEVFSADEFYKIARCLELFAQKLTKDIAATVKSVGAVNIEDSCQKLGLILSLAQFRRITELFEENPDADIKHAVRNLQERIQDEMSGRMFLYVPFDDAEFYKNSDSFVSSQVFKKWPNLLEDISESAKCFSLSRYTASVFHLMRVMEFGVQKLGDNLGVGLTTETNWQSILDQVNRAIKALDQKAGKTKRLASISANLYNVKLAWRNEVMHPKVTYTREEAKMVLDAVKAFIEELASLV